MKKNVWDQLLLISNCVQMLEKERYEYMNMMREMKENRERKKKEIEQNKILYQQEELEL
jgi:hypothetical protein